MPETATPALLDPEFLHKLEQLELVSKNIFVGRMKGEPHFEQAGAARRSSSPTTGSTRSATTSGTSTGTSTAGLLIGCSSSCSWRRKTSTSTPCSTPACRWTSASRPKLRLWEAGRRGGLSFIGLVNHDRVMLDTFSTGLDAGMSSVRGRSQMYRIVGYLDQLKANGAPAT